MRAAALFALAPALAVAQWSHGWTTGAVMQWADFGSPSLLPAERLTFIASTFAIVSLEKCLGQAVPLPTEDAYILTARALKALAPNMKTLFYFHASVDISGPSFRPCYAAGAFFLAHPELWLYGDDGVTPVMNGPFLFHNLTLAATQRYMIDTPLGVLQRAPELFDGVFADGALAGPITNVSAARTAAFNAELYALGLTQSLALNAARPDAPGGVQVILSASQPAEAQRYSGSALPPNLLKPPVAPLVFLSRSSATVLRSIGRRILLFRPTTALAWFPSTTAFASSTLRRSR